MAELTVQLIKGDKVSSKVDYKDALSENISPIIRQLFNIQGYMLQQPGLSAFGTGFGIDRGGVWNERVRNHFRVSGTQFLEVSAAGVPTLLGAVAGTDTVSMPYSFQTQAIIADGSYFLYDTTNGFRQIIDIDLGLPIDAIWVDGYYFFTDGEYLYHTDLEDEESIDPLKFATAEFSPDPTVGIGLTTDDKVIAFNRYTIEYFVNDANEEFAFSRLPSRALKYGLVGTHAKCEIGGQYYFLGGPKEGDLSIYMLGVGEVLEIASRSVTQLLSVYTEAEVAVAQLESRILEGYPVIIVHLPNETLLYNVKIGKFAGPEQAWSLLSSVGGTQWRALHGIFEPRVGAWIYGDRTDERLGKLNTSIATQYGSWIQCLLYTPFMYLETASMDELDIETIPGFNAAADATVFIAFTYDGVIWSAEQILQYGLPGAFGARFIARRLGYVSNIVAMRLRWASTSRMCFSKATISYG